MKKFDATIHTLAKAIYQSRPLPGANFDPDFALSELLSVGAPAGAELLLVSCRLHGRQVVFDMPRLKALFATEHTENAKELYMLFQMAILAHEPFTDVLGLANELMFKRHGVRLPDYFISPEFRTYCQAFAEASLGKGPPVLMDTHDRSSSGVLASMSGLFRQPALLAQQKVRIKITAHSDNALQMLFMQLGVQLCNSLHFVASVEFSEGLPGKEGIVMALLDSHAPPVTPVVKEAA